MSFLKKIVSDAVLYKERKKKKGSKGNVKSENQEYSSRGSSIICSNCTNVHIGDNLTLSNTTVFNNEMPEKSFDGDSSEPVIPKDVQNNFSSIDEPTLYQFLLVSESLKSGWRDLGLHLGFTEYELENYSSEEEKVYRMLLDWKRARTNEATVGRLLKSLWDAKEYDAAKRLSDEISAE